MQSFYKIISVFIFLLLATSLHGQTKGVNDTILMSAIVINNDTLPHHLIREVLILAEPTMYSKRDYRQERKRMTEYERLRYNVYKTYPYAVMAGIVMRDIDSAMLVMKSKSAKQLYKQKKEKELMRQYRGELEDLTMTQGKILVKLIARQTNKDCYETIKELKGGLNARIWQTLAILFQNDLKGGYQATGRDADIEAIVQEIEKRGRFKRVPK